MGWEMVSYILYASELAQDCGNREIADILAVSRRNNVRNGVTGMLMSKQGHFLQYIEGPDSSIVSLFTKIEVDGRHRQLNVVERGQSSERIFHNWEMGFADEVNMQPLNWKWELDKISMFSLVEEGKECLKYVKQFLQEPAFAAAIPNLTDGDNTFAEVSLR